MGSGGDGGKNLHAPYHFFLEKERERERISSIPTSMCCSLMTEKSMSRSKSTPRVWLLEKIIDSLLSTQIIVDIHTGNNIIYYCIQLTSYYTFVC